MVRYVMQEETFDPDCQVHTDRVLVHMNKQPKLLSKWLFGRLIPELEVYLSAPPSTECDSFLF